MAESTRPGDPAAIQITSSAVRPTVLLISDAANLPVARPSPLLISACSASWRPTATTQKTVSSWLN